MLAAAALLSVAGALAGCQPYVQGNGVYREERRNDLGAFTGVHLEDGIEATVTAGIAQQMVTVSGDANVLPYIETEVRTEAGRKVLRVWISALFAGTIPPRAVIEVPSLEYAFATQSARVNGKKLAAKSFEVVADQGSTIVLAGAATPAGESIDVKLASGAVLDATAYAVSEAASVDLSGASTAKLRSAGAVGGTVLGGSLLDNRQGTGSCTGVVKDGASTVLCP